MLNDDVKDFLKTFRILTYGNSKWQVWQDFIFMSACSFSNVVAKNDYVNRENAYLQTINKYNERDRKLFPKLLAKLTMALEHNPEQDFLGKIFMELDLGSRNRGQFFTPYHVSKLMAKMTITDDKVKRDEILTLYEPCCGSAGMVLASMDILKNDYGVNYARDCFVVCEDVDLRCVHMAFLQLSLAGVPAIIKHQNTLSREFWSVWRTPAYIMQYLRFRKYESLN